MTTATTLVVSRQQAQMIAEAVTVLHQAAERHALIITAATAGLVPHDATLTDVNVDTGVLTFHVKEASHAD